MRASLRSFVLSQGNLCAVCAVYVFLLLLLFSYFSPSYAKEGGLLLKWRPGDTGIGRVLEHGRRDVGLKLCFFKKKWGGGRREYH